MARTRSAKRGVQGLVAPWVGSCAGSTCDPVTGLCCGGNAQTCCGGVTCQTGNCGTGVQVLLAPWAGSCAGSTCDPVTGLCCSGNAQTCCGGVTCQTGNCGTDGYWARTRSAKRGVQVLVAPRAGSCAGSTCDPVTWLCCGGNAQTCCGGVTCQTGNCGTDGYCSPTNCGGLGQECCTGPAKVCLAQCTSPGKAPGGCRTARQSAEVVQALVHTPPGKPVVRGSDGPLPCGPRWSRQAPTAVAGGRGPEHGRGPGGGAGDPEAQERDPGGDREGRAEPGA